MTVLDQTASYSRLLCSPQTHKFAHKLVLVCKCTQVPTYAPITLALHAQTCSTMHSTTLTTNTLTATWIFAVPLLLYPSEGCVCCGADQRTSDLALVVCFWKHFLVLYVPVLWMVSFTEDINEQPWGLHEHPTVQYKQHLSRDHSELWAKFSIEMPWL